MTKWTHSQNPFTIDTDSFLPEQTSSILVCKSKKRKKTITITVKPDNSILAMAPFHMEQERIINFIHSKKEWIKKIINQQKNNAAGSKIKKFIEGELFPYLGQHYTLKIKENHSIALDGNSIAVGNNDQNKTKKLFIKWYKKETIRLIKEKTNFYSKHMNLFPKSIKITSARQRWGSCTHADTLNFPWRIICLPPNVIDYIVIHELAHINQKNHSRRFWEIISTVLPDYKTRRKWLKEKAANFDISFP